jgi:hypothetical protein
VSRRKQGRPKGGRAARHHEPRGFAPPPEPRRHDPEARDYVADGRQAVAEYFDRKHAADKADEERRRAEARAGERRH